MKQLEKYRWLILAAIYFVISWAFYKNTSQSKFLYDWNSWTLHYIVQGWPGLLNCYTDRSIHFGYHLFNMLQWKVFGLNGKAWLFTTLLIHATNGALLALLAQKILRITSLPDKFLIGAVAGLVWVISPYHSETIVWAAATQYLTSTALILMCSLFFLRFTETLQYKFLAAVFICFLLAMLTFEAFITLPLILFVLWLTTSNTAINTLPLSRLLKMIVLPMIAGIVIYFLANKWRIGSWVGHYGTASHLNADPFLIVPNFSKYLLKLFYVPLYFTFQKRDAVYAFIETKQNVLLIWAAYILLFAALAWVYFKKDKKWKVGIGMFVLFCVALLPVINLYFMYYKDIEQDRYVYFASIFFYMAITVLLFAIAGRWALIPVAACLFISVQFLQRNNYRWRESGRIATSLMNDFKWPNASRVFVLLSPDTYDGAYCMRSYPQSTLTEMLFVQRGIDVRKNMQEVYQWNVMSPTDSATCEVKDSVTLQVKLVSNGGWLWRNSFGAGSYHTGEFKTEVDQWYPWFTVQFNNRRPGDVFIYAVNDHWKKVEGF